MVRHILIIDDEENLTFFLKQTLEQEDYIVYVAHTISEGRKIVESQFPDLLLLDQNLPDGNGLDLYIELKKEDIVIPTIVITAHSSIQSAIDAMKSGVDDYIAKPFDMKELTMMIDNLLERYQLRNQLNYYRRKVQGSKDFDYFVSKLPGLQEIQNMALKIAEVAVSTVLIEGATGTGKEMLARYIHANSAQAESPFIEINCASLPENLLESELFGYEAGAFTDAKRRKIGLIELAKGGTLFLDEIAEMRPALQAKLLRFLETHSFKRLGGIHDIHVDTRVIAATNRDIEKLVEEEIFRKDLYFRLNLFHLKLPTMLERKEEVLLIAEYFLQNLTKQLNRGIKHFAPPSRELLLNYHWPGNLRELHNVIERAVILGNSDSIEPQYLPREIQKGDYAQMTPEPKLTDLGEKSLKQYLNDMESIILKQAMQVSEGNQIKAAKLLNEPRHIIRYLLKKHNLKSAEN